MLRFIFVFILLFVLTRLSSQQLFPLHNSTQIYELVNSNQLSTSKSAFELSILGKYEEADFLEQDPFLELQEHTLIHSNHFSTILNGCKNTNIVVFGTSHHKSYQYDVIYNLLDSLYFIGYRYLAMEALTNHYMDSTALLMDKDLMSRGSPIFGLISGSYTRDPMLSNLIRKAIDLGFTLVAYERMNRNMEREERQARNIFRKIYQDKPDAKTIVVAGLFHTIEQGKTKKRMAEYLSELTGINPYTVYLNYTTPAVKRQKQIDNKMMRTYKISKGYCDLFIEFLEPVELAKINFHEQSVQTILNTKLLDSLSYPLLISIYKKEDAINVTPLGIIQLETKISKTKFSIPKYDGYYFRVNESDEKCFFSL